MENSIFYYDKLLEENTNWNNLAIVLDQEETKILVRGLVNNESLDFTIKNEWRDISGIPAIGSIKGTVNEVRANIAKYSAVVREGKDLVRNVLQRLSTDKDNLSDMVNLGNPIEGTGLEGFMEKTSKSIDEGTDWLNEKSQISINTADEYMKLFTGTGIDIPATNVMEVLITDTTDKDIYNDLADRYVKFVGRYKNSKDISGLSSFLGYTSAPNGFRTSLAGLISDKETNERKGTFTIYMNGYVFRGLLVNSMNIQVSSTKVNTKKGLRPLYLIINYVFEPAVKYTSKNLEQWFKPSETKYWPED